MKGLKKYSHRDREKVIEELVPLVRKKFGDNLIAITADGSYARGEDSGYSDLELFAFVREMPGGKEMEGMSRIRDGLLVELVWTTREAYIKKVKEVTEEWYIAGSDTLLPIINEDFVNDLNGYRVENLREKCLKELIRFWSEVQEATAKVLNAINQENRDGLPMLLFYMLNNMLIALSLINRIPYITLSKFFTMARSFKVKPEKFDELLDMVVSGHYQDLPTLHKLTVDIFEGFEKIFDELGIEVYHTSIDPADPGDIFTIK
jgi:predicted nucleotidyltransferase